MELRGGCLCGDVRYEFSGEPYRKFVCHCRDCQRSGGSLFHAGVAVPRADFRLTQGALATYESAADSGRIIQRKFCARCGSGVLNEPAVWPDYVVIRVGTLDDLSLISPTAELYAAARAPWITIKTA
jgi:hypothetical protein